MFYTLLHSNFCNKDIYVYIIYSQLIMQVLTHTNNDKARRACNTNIEKVLLLWLTHYTSSGEIGNNWNFVFMFDIHIYQLYSKSVYFAIPRNFRKLNYYKSSYHYQNSNSIAEQRSKEKCLEKNSVHLIPTSSMPA